ncbi:NUDIX hydrolase [Candidatus Parcubacteria bacterium]|nr:MAG: NUDIX hydrolase [Candidatus Parcubacteria bacterium]
MKIEYENPWFKVVEDNGHYYLVEDASTNGAIILLTINDSFVFVKAKRPAHRLYLLETPRGYGDPGESSELCAIRELREETGYSFKVSDLERIGYVRPNTAILSAKIPVFLIESGQKQKGEIIDKEEVSEVVFLSKDKIHEEISRGNITDGMTLSALSLYWAKKQAPK